MTPTRKISVTVPANLLDAVAREMLASARSRSAVVSECIRAQLDPEAGDRLDDLERRLARIEEMAER